MIRVIGDRVLVALKPDPEEFVTDSGLVLARDPDKFRTPTQGIVMALGEKTESVLLDDVLAVLAEHSTDGEDVVSPLYALKPAPFDVEVGDCVLFSRGAGDALSADGMDYVVLFESEILCVLEPLKQHEAA